MAWLPAPEPEVPPLPSPAALGLAVALLLAATREDVDAGAAPREHLSAPRTLNTLLCANAIVN